MQMLITRPVVISSTAGLRHFAPGLTVNLTEAEAAQVLRQKAGSDSAAISGDEPAPVKTSTKTPKAKAKTE